MGKTRERKPAHVYQLLSYLSVTVPSAFPRRQVPVALVQHHTLSKEPSIMDAGWPLLSPRPSWGFLSISKWLLLIQDMEGSLIKSVFDIARRKHDYIIAKLSQKVPEK